MPLIIINTTTIHVALTNSQTERFICPWLIIIRRNRIIVLIENNCFRIWIWTLEFRQDKRCCIGLVNCHLCANTRENLTKVSSYVIETNILSKNRFFEKSKSAKLQKVSAEQFHRYEIFVTALLHLKIAIKSSPSYTTKLACSHTPSVLSLFL